MKDDKTFLPEAMFTASILFIYIQLLYYCRYVITIGYLSHWVRSISGSLNQNAVAIVKWNVEKYITLAKSWFSLYMMYFCTLKKR